jgi:hypothetical protein
VNRFLYLLLFQLFFVKFIFAQTAFDSAAIKRADSLLHNDTIIHKDSLLVFPIADSVSRRPLLKDSDTYIINHISFSVQNISKQILQHHPYFGFTATSLTIRSDIRQFQSKDLLFYVLIALLLIYALLRNTFPKYFHDLFRLFFRTTLKQLQIREQLMQTPLPSLLLNIFFIVSEGLYINFLLHHAKLNPVDNFWLMSAYCIVGLAIIYFVKYLGLKLSGWLFNMQEAANSYIFIVFIINKMIGILLLPFLILLAFTQGNIYSVSLTLSWIIIAGLLAYRFVLTYAAVRNQVKVNPFHFFLYLCAFEIAPLLLIYRGLLLFFHLTA